MPHSLKHRSIPKISARNSIGNALQNLKALPREVWVIAIATFINRAGTMVLFFLTYYLRQDQFGFSLGMVGFVVAIFGIGSLVSAPLSGWLSDRVGALQVMKLSLVLSGAILLIYPLAQSFFLIVVLSFICAVTAEAFRPASYAILNAFVSSPDQAEMQRKSKSAHALYRLAVNLGFTLGPFIGGLMATRGLWRAIFIIDGATSIMAFVYLSLILRPVKFQNEPIEIHTTEGATIQAPSTKAIGDPRFRYFLIAIAPTFVILFLELGPLPQFMKIVLEIPESYFGYLVSLNAVLIILLELPLTWATGGWSYRRSLTCGAMLIAIGFGAVSLANGFLMIALTVLIWTFGEMFLLPNAIAFVGSIAPKRRQGEYVGIYSMLFSLCMSLGPWVGLFALGRFPRMMWVVAFLMGSFSALMLSRLDR